MKPSEKKLAGTLCIEMHKQCNAGPEVIKLFSCSTQLRMKF